MFRHILLWSALTCFCADTASAAGKGLEYLNAIGTPAKLAPTGKTVVVAIVDDGVRITHQDLKDLIWKNPGEIPDNGIDDDGNGYVDDVHGWDISDGDNGVNPPAARADVFYHGTHLAGIVARIARAALGPEAPKYISIMPVKCLSDRADKTWLKDGYSGIDYALRNGADVVLAAWGVAFIAPDEEAVLQRAIKQDVLIIASAGNFPEERPQYPAAHAAALAIAAVDGEGHKTDRSNFGDFVDLSAPGVDIVSTSAASDTGEEMREGTSQASAMVAAAAALVMLGHPSYSSTQIRACLKNTADEIEGINGDCAGKLGAGRLNVAAAAACTLFEQDTARQNITVRPQGYLYVRSGQKPVAWTIHPPGSFKGLRFTPASIKDPPPDAAVVLHAGPDAGSTCVGKYPLSAFPASVYVPGTSAHVTFNPPADNAAFECLLEYRTETIDLSELYCRETRVLTAEGAFDDGSGTNDYAANTNCKWLIAAPVGKVIRIEFTEFDTEPKVDFLYFFDGEDTHEKIMAIYSGPNLPPPLTTWRNKVLVWFVADGQNQHRGWKANIAFVQPPSPPPDRLTAVPDAVGTVDR